MNNTLCEYKNPNFDSKLTGLINGLKDCFDLSIKGVFVLLAAGGLKFENSYELKIANANNDHNGAEFRAGTDNEYDAAIDILLTKLSIKKNKHNIIEILTDKTLINEYMDELMNYAVCFGKYLIANDLIQFKNGVSQKDFNDFIISAGNVINDVFDTNPDF